MTVMAVMRLIETVYAYVLGQRQITGRDGIISSHCRHRFGWCKWRSNRGTWDPQPKAANARHILGCTNVYHWMLTPLLHATRVRTAPRYI